MTTMTGAQAALEVMASEGVEYLFANPGSTFMAFHDGMVNYPQIKYVMALHENTAVGIADGYSRTSGKVGVVNVHAIEGVCNSMAAIYNAYHCSAKIAMVVGRADSESIMRESLWHDDMVQITRNHTKWSVDVRDSYTLPMIMRRLFKVISEPPAGPALVSIPMDVQARTIDIEIPPKSNIYNSVLPDPTAIDKAASLLANAKSPAIVVGDRVAQSKAVPEVVKLAEILGARVIAAAQTELNFPMNHPLYIGMDWFGSASTVRTLGGSDIVLVVGANLGKHTVKHKNPPYPPNIKLIQMDFSTVEMAKNYPVELGIMANCKIGLQSLIDSVRDHMTASHKEAASQRVKEISLKTAQRNEAAMAKAQTEWNSTPISLPRFYTEVKKALDPGTIVITEAISTNPMLWQFLAPSEPGTHFYTPGGSLGWGMPAVLGAKLGAPDRPVVGLIGDGSSMYAIQALWTAAHYHIPAVFVIINNRRYDMLRLVWRNARGKEPQYDDVKYYVDLSNPSLDFVKMAESYGVAGRSVMKAEDLAPVLKESLQSKEPVLVEVGVQTVDK